MFGLFCLSQKGSRVIWSQKQSSMKDRKERKTPRALETCSRVLSEVWFNFYAFTVYRSPISCRCVVTITKRFIIILFIYKNILLHLYLLRRSTKCVAFVHVFKRMMNGLFKILFIFINICIFFIFWYKTMIHMTLQDADQFLNLTNITLLNSLSCLSSQKELLTSPIFFKFFN